MSDSSQGRVELHCEGRQLPYSLFDRDQVVSQGAIVENKRLAAVLTVIQGAQAEVKSLLLCKSYRA